jgi:hypothetical protein
MSKLASKKRKSSILKLKVLIEDLTYSEEELMVGVSEISDILKEFSERIDVNQKEEFNNYFFGNKSPDAGHENLTSMTDMTIHSPKKDTVSKSTKKAPVEGWVKKLYKQIVQRSHPDKYVDFPIKAIKEKFTNVYMLAVESYQHTDIGMLLLCADEVEIDTSNIAESVQYINETISKKNVRLAEIKNLIGYQWYHLPDNNRLTFLESYIKQLGYKFNKEKAVAVVIKNRQKRKVGARPEKLRVKRNQAK